MKKYILIISVIILGSSFVNAQSAKEEVDFIQAVFGMEKKALIAEFVLVPESQETAFWEIYDEYETKRKTLGQQRYELLYEYAEEYENLTSEQADEWTKKVMTLQGKTDKLIATYYKKVKKISDGMVATQFYQIETYILTEIRAEILEDIPFVQDL